MAKNKEEQVEVTEGMETTAADLTAAPVEETTTEETAVEAKPVKFKTVKDFISHLVASGEAVVTTEYVVNEINEILERKPVVGEAKGRRGQLAGISDVSFMTDEQLSREIINANSVLYKAVQRGASVETIAKNQERVDRAKAEKDSRKPATAPVAEQASEGAAAESQTTVDETHAVEAEI